LNKGPWVGLKDKVMKRLLIKEVIFGDKDITLIVHCNTKGTHVGGGKNNCLTTLLKLCLKA
jgi:hypothetical protein